MRGARTTSQRPPTSSGAAGRRAAAGARAPLARAVAAAAAARAARRGAEAAAAASRGAARRRLRGGAPARRGAAALEGGAPAPAAAWPPPARADALVAGAGPAGLALAAALGARGARVVVADPRIGAPWPNNYGVWADELRGTPYEACLAHVWPETLWAADSAAGEAAVLPRAYAQVDRVALKARLLEECAASGNVSFVEGAATRAAPAAAGGGARTAVAVRRARRAAAGGGDGGRDEAVVEATLAFDATGFKRALLRYEEGEVHEPGYQVTYGAFMEIEEGSCPWPLHQALLMDWADAHLDAAGRARNAAEPSFLYAMPFSATRIFVEETSLVAKPPVSSAELEARLAARLAALGVAPVRTLEEERAMIPMGSAIPALGQEVVAFGGAAGTVHPSTGYLVARALEQAPLVAGAAAPALRRGDAAAARAAAWGALWPADALRQRDFMNLGMEQLCRLGPEQLRAFFRAFFALPQPLWGGFLSWRLTGLGHLFMGVSLLARHAAKLDLVAVTVPHLPEYLANFAGRGGPPAPGVYARREWSPEGRVPGVVEERRAAPGAEEGAEEGEEGAAVRRVVL